MRCWRGFKPFYSSTSNPLFFFLLCSSRVQKENSDYRLPVQFHLSSHRHLGADIINLFLVHLSIPWDILQVSSSADTFVPQGEFILCHKSLTLNILIDMFQESLNKLCWESLVNNSSSKRKQTLLEKVCIMCNSKGKMKKNDQRYLDSWFTTAATPQCKF